MECEWSKVSEIWDSLSKVVKNKWDISLSKVVKRQMRHLLLDGWKWQNGILIGGGKKENG